MRFLHCPRNGNHHYAAHSHVSPSTLICLIHTAFLRSNTYGAVGIVNEVI
jgi:hypothetical protein